MACMPPRLAICTLTLLDRLQSITITTMYFFLSLSSFNALLTKAYQTAAVLFEVLKAVNVSQSVEVDQAVGF
jgi:hypothetical protein